MGWSRWFSRQEEQEQFLLDLEERQAHHGDRLLYLVKQAEQNARQSFSESQQAAQEALAEACPIRPEEMACVGALAKLEFELGRSDVARPMFEKVRRSTGGGSRAQPLHLHQHLGQPGEVSGRSRPVRPFRTCWSRD